MCIASKSPAVAPVVTPEAVPAARAPEPTPTAPVTQTTASRKREVAEAAEAKRKGTNSLIIPLNVPAAGSGLSIPA
jgi:hypothetical protein